MNPENRGFVALISAIIISVILLALAVAVSSSTFFARFNALNREYKRISLGLAESCVQAALGKISRDYGYVVPSGGEVVELDQVYGRDVSCTITGPTSAPSDVGGKKVFSIRTEAEFEGAFSSLIVSATAQDPEEAPVVPPPNCVLQVSPTSVPQGQTAQILWSTSSNAASMSIDHGIGGVGLSGPPWVSVTPSGVGAITYTGTVSNAGGSNTCAATLTVTAPPPAPACADTVMMLDRSLSMFGYPNYPSGYAQWIPNEKAAAKRLIDLYDGVSSNPLVGWGRIGDLSGGHGADLAAQLSSGYAALKSSIDNGLPQNPTGYTNLGEAIDVGAAELDSVRHDTDKEKVLIFVSDGVPNEPSGGIPGDTGWRNPSATAAPNEWSAPTGGFASDNVRASAGNDDDDQGYRSFGFSIPSNATIRGIEVGLEGYVTGGGPQNALIWSDGFGTGSDQNDIADWDEEGSDGDSSTLARQNQGSGEDTASPDGGRFARIGNGEWICKTVTATGMTNVALRYYWRGDADAEDNETGVVEYRSGGSCTSASGWTTARTHELDDGNNNAHEPWSSQQSVALPDGFEGFVRFRNASNDSAEHFRIDGTSATASFTPVNTSCQLQARVGDAGTFSSYRSVTLSGTETAFSALGSATDDWDTVSWSPADFADSAFRLETRFNDPDASCDASSATAFLDHARVRVSYSVPVDPTQYAIDAAADAKGDDVKIFSIHFGDIAGLPLMGTLASASSFGSATISTASRSGGTATIVTAGPHHLAANQRVSITGVSQGAFNGIYTVTGVTNATTFRYALSGTGGGTGGSLTPMNVFVSPSSGAMDGIFESIGRQVCPAAAAECSNTGDDDGDGLVDDQDPGCHTDGNSANAASYDPDDNDEWTAPPVAAAPPPPPPPPNITIGSWIEN